jgi:hypothetical protein
MKLIRAQISISCNKNLQTLVPSNVNEARYHRTFATTIGSLEGHSNSNTVTDSTEQYGHGLNGIQVALEVGRVG